MALETLQAKTTIGGYAVEQLNLPEGVIKDQPVADTVPRFVTIDHKTNTIKFTIQNGPIKDNGINGCQVDTMIAAVKEIIDGLNKNFPSDFNKIALSGLATATFSLNARTSDRTNRGVEGTNQA